MIMMREGNASDDEDDDDENVQLILALSREPLRPLSGSPQPQDMWYAERSAVQLDMSSY